MSFPVWLALGAVVLAVLILVAVSLRVVGKLTPLRHALDRLDQRAVGARSVAEQLRLLQQNLVHMQSQRAAER